MKYDIITFGSAVVDVFVHTDVAEKKEKICYPIGGKILINKLLFDIGGGGTNTAVAFSRFGFKTGCICNVGDDENGHKILNLLKNEKIDFLGKVDKTGMTGYSVILDSLGGERTILTYKGVNDNIAIKDVQISLGGISTKWLYYSALLEKSFETQRKLIHLLRGKGVKLAFNPSSYIIKNENIFDLLKMCEVLILNKEEAYALYKKYKDNLDNCVNIKSKFSICPIQKQSKLINRIVHKAKGGLLEGLHLLGPRIVIVTNKDKGVWAYDGKKHYKLIPHKNIRVVERTGAGDAFASGFVAGLIVGKSIDESLKLGLKESESVITYRGAKNKLLRMKLKK